jgi:lipoyl(octanoyl) transferase
MLTRKHFYYPIDYQSMSDQMELDVDSIYAKKQKSIIYFLEHKNVFTLGNASSDDDILDKNLPYIRSKRGGMATFHGKGQRIIYPVIDLKEIDCMDVKRYVYLLEEAIILSLKEYRIKASRSKAGIGIFVEHNNVESKIAFIGIKIRKWIAYHGISININPDINNFNKIIPCGLKEIPITSLEKLNVNTDYREFDDFFVKALQNVL